MANQNKGKYIGWIFWPIILCYVVQDILTLVLMEIYLVRDLGTYKSGTYIDFISNWTTEAVSTTSNTIISISYAVICAILFFFIYKKLFAGEKAFAFKDASKNWAYTLIGLILFVISAVYVCTFLVNALSAAFPNWLEEYEQLLETSGLDQGMSIAMAIYTVVIGPICEELCFRGLTFKSASKVMKPIPAILISSILFGAYHMNMLQGSYAFFLGLGLGYVMYKYDNLLITILIHIGFNLLGTANMEIYMIKDNYTGFFLTLLLSLIVCYGAILLLKKGAPEVKKND